MLDRVYLFFCKFLPFLGQKLGFLKLFIYKNLDYSNVLLKKSVFWSRCRNFLPEAVAGVEKKISGAGAEEKGSAPQNWN